MWKMVRPSTPMRERMPFGVALSGPPSWLITDTNLWWSSGVHLSRDFVLSPLPACLSNVYLLDKWKVTRNRYINELYKDCRQGELHTGRIKASLGN